MFDDKPQTIPLDARHSITLWPAAFADQADQWLEQLQSALAWQQDTITIAGKSLPVPRLQVWYGDNAYQYSGLTMAAKPMPPLLADIKSRVQELTGQTFNAVLANLYRNGQDSVSWHSDDEPELGPAPVIASLSLGAQRRFCLRPKQCDSGKRTVKHIELPHGSLLVMEAGMQAAWQHALLKEKGIERPRINLTFRSVRGGVRRDDMPLTPDPSPFTPKR